MSSVSVGAVLISRIDLGRPRALLAHVCSFTPKSVPKSAGKQPRRKRIWRAEGALQKGGITGATGDVACCQGAAVGNCN